MLCIFFHFFYPAVPESIIRHGGHHSSGWKPACVPETQDKPSAVDSSEGWRSPTAPFAPSGLLGEVFGHAFSDVISHLFMRLSPQGMFYSSPKYRLDCSELYFCCCRLQLNAERNKQGMSV